MDALQAQTGRMSATNALPISALSPTPVIPEKGVFCASKTEALYPEPALAATCSVRQYRAPVRAQLAGMLGGVRNDSSKIQVLVKCAKRKRHSDVDRTSTTRRALLVQEAAHRLSKLGYAIEKDSRGKPSISENSRLEIVRCIKGYIRLLGGIKVADQVLRILRETNQIHDGLWLFGNSNLAITDPKIPLPPFGWLFSLALSEFGTVGNARKPEIAWKTLVNLCTDFAAVHDCQRYDQFDEVFIDSTNLVDIFQNSILWREFFTLPQVPRQSLSKILDVLREILSEEDQQAIGFSIAQVSREIKHLAINTKCDRFVSVNLSVAAPAFPLLFTHSGGPRKNVNINYGDPLTLGIRDHDYTIFLATSDSNIVLLPTSLLCSSVCHWLFKKIWDLLPSRAPEILKSTIELAIHKNCSPKASSLVRNHEYTVDAEHFEMDIVAADHTDILLIEAKAKSITTTSRSGDFFSLSDDLSKSFLAMLGQLARNETHLKKKLTGLHQIENQIDKRSILKVAISPLSFGPISDKLLATQWLSALVNRKLGSDVADSTQQKKLHAFNKALFKALESVLPLIPEIKRQAH